MSAPIDLEPLRAAFAVINNLQRTGYLALEYPKLRNAHDTVAAILAELTTRRARDEEIAQALRDAVEWVGEYMDQNDCDEDDEELDVSVCMKRIRAALANLTGATP